jgi:hypothetical protein
MSEGKEPYHDAAVSIIAARIGFASPASVMGEQGWSALIDTCMTGNSVKIEPRKELLN